MINKQVLFSVCFQLFPLQGTSVNWTGLQVNTLMFLYSQRNPVLRTFSPSFTAVVRDTIKRREHCIIVIDNTDTRPIIRLYHISVRQLV